jgi:hypothetical protein
MTHEEIMKCRIIGEEGEFFSEERLQEAYLEDKETNELSNETFEGFLDSITWHNSACMWIDSILHLKDTMYLVTCHNDRESFQMVTDNEGWYKYIEADDIERIREGRKPTMKLIDSEIIVAVGDGLLEEKHQYLRIRQFQLSDIVDAVYSVVMSVPDSETEWDENQNGEIRMAIEELADIWDVSTDPDAMEKADEYWDSLMEKVGR